MKATEILLRGAGFDFFSFFGAAFLLLALGFGSWAFFLGAGFSFAWGKLVWKNLYLHLYFYRKINYRINYFSKLRQWLLSLGLLPLCTALVD